MTTVQVHSTTVSPPGLLRMEDRKRPASYDNEDPAPPTKRQVTAVANGSTRGHQDADIPGRDDLEKFQKEAILRQMQEYKREKQSLESQLNDLSKKSANHDDHIRAIDAWFSQLLDEVRLMVGKMEGGSYVVIPSTLLSSDSKSFQEYLESRSKAVSAAIEQIFGSKPDAQPAAAELQGQISKLLEKEKVHINEMEKLKLDKDQMEERLETASMRYMMAEKKLDRAKSMTVAKLERQATVGGRSDTGSGLGGDSGKQQETTNGQVDSEALLEAERGRKAAEALSAKQSEQLDQLAAEIDKYNARISEFEKKRFHSSEDDVLRSELFKTLKAQYEETVKKLNHLEAENSDLRSENKKEKADKTAYRAKVDAEAAAAISERDHQLSKAESDLARIRTARDELHADVQVRKAAQDQERTSVNQVKQLIAARDERIQALESEVERQKASEAGEPASSVETLSAEELKTKYTSLERQYSMLNQELMSMSSAYKKMSTTTSMKVANLSDLEEKVMRLTAEKSKADQKYFAAMKAKETRDHEVRALRAQNAKSSDIVSQLKEAESAARTLVINLEKQLAESGEVLAGCQTQLRDAQSQLEQKKVEVEGSKKRADEATAFVASKDAQISTISSAQRKAEAQIEELKSDLDEKQKRIEVWQKKGLGSENEHYEVLRSLAICTVCRKNFKETALKTCGHVFCRECIEDRLQSRMRKCPNCNKPFGANDHMRITL